MKKDKRIICKSGAEGWQNNLRNVYDSFEEFKSYCEVYAIHTRIGFKSIKGAWRVNPIIQGSENPSDLRRVK